MDIQANSTKLAEVSDLSNISSKYYEFADAFSKTKAEVLPPYRPYDLKINLEEGAQPLVGPIYSLSASEQEALKEFIEENLAPSRVAANTPLASPSLLDTLLQLLDSIVSILAFETFVSNSK